MKRLWTKTFLVSLCLGWSSLHAAPKEIVLFNSNAELNLDISGDFKAIFNGKKDPDPFERTLHDISISYLASNKKVQNIFAMTEVRGWSRLAECDFPPLKLKFLKNMPKEDNLFYNITTLKVVTRCNNKKRLRWVNKELALYKIYEVLEPLSLKTRAFNANYRSRVSTDYNNLNGKILSSQFSFLLESSSMLGDRFKMTELEVAKYDKSKISKISLAKVNLFNLMIRNFDIEVSRKDVRNIKIMKAEDETVYGVPYDFDYSDWVRGEQIGPHNKTYGFCSDYAEVAKVAPTFIEKRDQILAMIKEQTYLNQEEKNSLTNLVSDFMKFISNNANLVEITGPAYRKRCLLD